MTGLATARFSEARLAAKIGAGSYSDCTSIELAFALRRFDHLSPERQLEVGRFLAFVVLFESGIDPEAVRS